MEAWCLDRFEHGHSSVPPARSAAATTLLEFTPLPCLGMTNNLWAPSPSRHALKAVTHRVVYIPSSVFCLYTYIIYNCIDDATGASFQWVLRLTCTQTRPVEVYGVSAQTDDNSSLIASSVAWLLEFSKFLRPADARVPHYSALPVSVTAYCISHRRPYAVINKYIHIYVFGQ